MWFITCELPSPFIPKFEPAPKSDKAPIAIDVETLLRSPSPGAGSQFQLLLRKHILVRQDVDLHTDRVLPSDPKEWPLKSLPGMPGHEWIPRSDNTPVQSNTDCPISDQSVERHRKMVLDSFGEIVKVTLPEPGYDDAIQHFPEYQGPMLCRR